jgi:hypothetical protein
LKIRTERSKSRRRKKGKWREAPQNHSRIRKEKAEPWLE